VMLVFPASTPGLQLLSLIHFHDHCRVHQSQQTTTPSCPCTAIESHLSISGRVVAGYRAANPPGPWTTADPWKPYPISLGETNRTTCGSHHPARKV